MPASYPMKNVERNPMSEHSLRKQKIESNLNSNKFKYTNQPEKKNTQIRLLQGSGHHYVREMVGESPTQ